MEAELMSSRSKHSKWDSLMHDENFTTAATAYLREHGYEGCSQPHIIRRVFERCEVEISDETARVWLHQQNLTLLSVQLCAAFV